MLKRESILGMVNFMATSVFFGALVILLAVLAEKFAGKFKLPALILFMFIGMLFGSDGLFKIPFSNYRLADQICSLALVFIMFYGGFNTKWKVAKSSAPKSLLLSTLGVIITAGITTVLAVYLLHFKLLEALLIGAVLSSTDAASVFAILHQQKVNLKYNTASLLELESGSNDPVAYLLTALIIGFITGAKQVNIPLEILLQVSMGLWWGFILAKLAVYLLTQTNLIAEGLETIFLMGMMLLCYALTEVTAGNVFLSIYLLGLIIGNAQIANKQVIIPSMGLLASHRF
ncbi:cation:proton antiporter domain-containing protein [Ligilactobacillus agilis]|uniref:cation:proton antiporter domain-containing protein n=1 Tax=Ligilactobacillus agilis TaxID=1601 RepID=UPI003F8AA490